MDTLHEAAFYESRPDGRVLCTLCPHNCRITDGVRGACGVRVNHHGTLYTLVYEKVIARHVEPVEKKPFFHFIPGSRTYSIATVGCCLRCAFCQNWEISQWPKAHLPRKVEWVEGDEAAVACPQLQELERAVPGERVTPRKIVDAARSSGAMSIAYTFTEPTVFFELAYDTAILARAAGLKNLFVTSGFINDAPLRQIATVLDAVNVDLKFFNEDSYRRISRARLQPVLDAVRLYHELGVWTEVTTLVIPGVNDSADELLRIARFIASVAPHIPWHVTQFCPAYGMLDRPPTPTASLRRACQVGMEAGLRYVYEGNVPGEGSENTRCYGCGSLLIERYGTMVRSNRIRNRRCPRCGTQIDGVLMDGPRLRARVATGNRSEGYR